EHDDDAGEVFHAPIAVGETLAWLSTRQRECGPKRHRGRRVAEVVNRVGEETYAPRKPGDTDLDRRRDRQGDERPLDRPDAAFRRGNGRVDHAVGMNVAAVAMRLCIPMVAVVLMAVIMTVAVIVP